MILHIPSFGRNTQNFLSKSCFDTPEQVYVQTGKLSVRAVAAAEAGTLAAECNALRPAEQYSEPVMRRVLPPVCGRLTAEEWKTLPRRFFRARFGRWRQTGCNSVITDGTVWTMPERCFRSASGNWKWIRATIRQRKGAAFRTAPSVSVDLSCILEDRVLLALLYLYRLDVPDFVRIFLYGSV